MSVPYLIELADRLASGGDTEALSIGGKRWSYGELATSVRRHQELFTAHGISRGDVVAVLASANPETYAACVAALLAGIVYMPINPNAPVSRSIECLSQARCRLLVNVDQGGMFSEWTRSDASRTTVTRHFELPTESGALRVAAELGDFAYLLFTSGSTGVPKGVPVHHRNVDAFLDAVIELPGMQIQESDRFLQMFELTFDLSVMSYLLPLVHGASFHVPTGGLGFLSIPRTLSECRVTIALMVPSVLGFLERYFDEIRLPTVRTSLFCGEALPSRLAQAWSACVPKARILNVYGPTEATIFCSSYELPRPPSAIADFKGCVSIGEPMRGTSFRVVDDSLEPTEEGDPGELLLVGEQVTSSYWNDAARTSKAFVTLRDGTTAYRTGDSAFYRDGVYQYVGRIDNQVKVDGFRVEPGEIEFHARSVDGVTDAVVVGSAGEKMRLVMFVLASTTSERAALAARIKLRLEASLPRYMQPSRIDFVDAFPLNTNGKIDRRALSVIAAND